MECELSKACQQEENIFKNTPFFIKILKIIFLFGMLKSFVYIAESGKLIWFWFLNNKTYKPLHNVSIEMVHAVLVSQKLLFLNILLRTCQSLCPADKHVVPTADTHKPFVYNRNCLMLLTLWRKSRRKNTIICTVQHYPAHWHTSTSKIWFNKDQWMVGQFHSIMWTAYSNMKNPVTFPMSNIA